VLLVSSELEEVMALSHRVCLMRAGRIVNIVDPATTSVDAVLFELFDVATAAERAAAGEPAPR
jgi:ABC-type sugar transport system ATPase subunit